MSKAANIRRAAPLLVELVRQLDERERQERTASSPACGASPAETRGELEARAAS